MVVEDYKPFMPNAMWEFILVSGAYEANLGVQEYAQNGRFSEGH